MKIEQVTEKQLLALSRCLTPSGRMISRIGEADLTKGRGVLDGDSRCLWTKSGHRITITPIVGGGLITSCSKDPDPECPK